MLTYYCDNARHLICTPYSVKNLHIMAENLGIKRCWYHGGKHPHYDIPKKRIYEIQEECEIVSSKELLSIMAGESWSYCFVSYAIFSDDAKHCTAGRIEALERDSHPYDKTEYFVKIKNEYFNDFTKWIWGLKSKRLLTKGEIISKFENKYKVENVLYE